MIASFHPTVSGWVLEAQVPPELAYEATFVASFSGRQHRWVQSGYGAGPGSVSIPLVLPAAAFLHPLATDYVTGLKASITGRDADGSAVLVTTPARLWVGWPNGADGPVSAWVPEQGRVEAPHGILTQAARAQWGDALDASRPEDVVAPPVEPPADRVVDQTSEDDDA